VVVLAEELEEAAEVALEAFELDVESDFLVSEELLFDSLDDVAAGVSAPFEATVLDDLASERASLR
jgi:hypothetical protein